jgi:phage tail protein X
MTQEELLRKSRAYRQLHLDTVDRLTFRKFVRHMKNNVKEHYDGVADRTIFLKFNIYVPQIEDEIPAAFKANEEAADICMDVLHVLINKLGGKYYSIKKK